MSESNSANNNSSNAEYSREDNKYFFKMFRFMRPFKFSYGIGLFFTASQEFMMDFLIASFVGGLTAAVVGYSMNALVQASVTLVIMFVVFMILISIGLWMFYMSTYRAMRELRRRLFASYMSRSLDGANSGHSGEGIAAINTDAGTAEGIFNNGIRNFLGTLFAIVFSAITVAVLDWRLGLIAVAIGFMGFAVQLRFVKPLSTIAKQRLSANADMVSAASDTFSGGMTIRAYNMQSRALLGFDKESGRIKLLNFKEGYITMWRTAFSQIQSWLILVAVFAFGGWLVATDRLELSALMMAFPLCVSITSNLSFISRAYANLQAPIAGAKRVFGVIEEAEKRDEEREAGKGTITVSGGEIAVDGLTFRYFGAENDALKDVTLKVAENEMVALVGESGSGKSTLLKAIVGLHTNDTDAKARRPHFAYVDQSCKLFDMSIRENIAMGLAGNATEEQVIAAAKRAAAHDFIMEQEGGYDAPCGEKGASLSGGQKQRIAIARALVKGSRVLVFDEATSALDAESEKQVMDTILSLRTDHTILITTHNLDNVATADRIVRMDGGRIDG